jgi:ABC-type lipoprotein release transport system permease subunit
MILSLAWRNLWRQPRRTVLTLAAIVVAGAITVFMLSMQVGTYRAMIVNTLELFQGEAQVQAAGYRENPQMERTITGLTAILDRLSEVEGITNITPRANGFAVLSASDESYGAAVIGVDPRTEPELSTIPQRLSHGRFLEGSESAEIVLGAGLARNLNAAVGDSVTLMGMGRDGSVAVDALSVVGIFESGISEMDRELSEMPLGRFQDTFGMPDEAHSIVFETGALRNVAATVDRARLALADGELVVLDWDQITPGLRQAITLDASTSGLIYLTLLVVVVFTVINTLLMALLERTREFGILLSIGVRPGLLGRIVWVETSLLAFLGVGGGVLVGLPLTLYFAAHGLSFGEGSAVLEQYGLPGSIYPEASLLTVLGGPGLIGLGVILSGFYPLVRIRRFEAVEAMNAP